MGSLRPLRGILFVYELVRFLALAGAFLYLDPGGGPFPWVAALAPNALFPLMALFFRIDASFRGAAYAPLYTAGKAAAVAAALGWLVFFPGLVRPAEDGAFFFMNGEYALEFLGGALFITVGDLFSIAGGLLLTRRPGTGPGTGPEPAARAGPAGRDLDKGA
jgi:hypothetical protein